MFTEAAPVNIGAIHITVVLGTVALMSVKESAWVTNVLVVINVVVRIFVIVLEAFFIKRANLTPSFRRRGPWRGAPAA